MPKLTVDYNKTLKLTNVITIELPLGDIDSFVILTQMENYIKSKGFQIVGPPIQYTNIAEDNTGKMGFIIKLMRQANGFIHDIEKPYKIASILKVPNCLYTRYCGVSEKMSFAYNKLTLTAFEYDIPLKGDSYTAFLNETDDNVIVDIFMEKADQ